MDTKPQADELERLEAINRELCQKIVDLEAEIERKHKAVEGFMAENEALKAELGGKRLTASANDRNTGGGLAQSESLNDLVAQARRLGW